MKAAVQSLLRRVGLEVRRAGNAPRSPFDAQARLLSSVSAPTIFDVGAHQGQTAKRYAALFPSARIVSFEPTPASFSELARTAATVERIDAHQLAIGEACGATTFHLGPVSQTNSLLRRPSVGRRYYPERAQLDRSIDVEVTTLDTFCEQRSLSRIDLLKMDIQGGELAALRGARSLLERHAIGVIFTEVMFVPHYEDAPLYHDIAAYLAGHGYSLYNLFIAEHGTNGQARYGDALFVSPRVRAEVLDAGPAEP